MFWNKKKKKTASLGAKSSEPWYFALFGDSDNTKTPNPGKAAHSHDCCSHHHGGSQHGGGHSDSGGSHYSGSSDSGGGHSSGGHSCGGHSCGGGGHH